MQKNPLKSYAAISDELKLSSKTVKKRIARLSSEGAIFLLADMSPKAIEGRIVCGLLIFYDKPETRDRVNQVVVEKIGDQILFTETDAKDHGYFGLVITNVSKANELLDWTKGLSGVVDGRIDLVQDIISIYGLYDEQIDRLLKVTPSSPLISRSRKPKP